MEATIAERFEKDLQGVLNCYDRIVINGNVQPWCYAKGMTGYLYEQKIRIFDFPKFAEPMRERIRTNAETLAKEAGVKIEHVSKKGCRKDPGSFERTGRRQRIGAYLQRDGRL